MISLPAVASQTRIVVSDEPDPRSLPSGEPGEHDSPRNGGRILSPENVCDLVSVFYRR
jgi:hypothetical protein